LWYDCGKCLDPYSLTPSRKFSEPAVKLIKFDEAIWRTMMPEPDWIVGFTDAEGCFSISNDAGG